MEIAAIQLPPVPADPDVPAPLAGTSPDSVPKTRPGMHLYRAFLTEAVSMVVEGWYFDLDRRSEIGELQELTFQPLNPTSSRLHFFSTEPGAIGTERLRDFVLRAKSESAAALKRVSKEATSTNPARDASTYLGYSIVRGVVGDPIGRSLVTPRAQIWSKSGDRLRVDADVVNSQVRTAVTEQVSLFGVSLIATGIPFLEQDGSLLRCAHVSAWMCHYAAVLRGVVPRRPTAHFHRAGDWKLALGRPFPSSGLSAMEVVTIMRNSDLPPERLDLELLMRPRPLNWADRSSTVKALAKPAELKDIAERLSWDLPNPVDADSADEAEDPTVIRKKKWIKENFGAAVCRYLNSGIPVIMVRNEISHTQVIVGYLRRSDLAEAASSDDTRDPPDDAWADLLADPPVIEADSESDIVKFIVADDRRGPYRLVSLHKLARTIRMFKSQAMVPLPQALWLSGDVAEQIATRQFTALTTSRLERIDEWSAIDGAEKSRDEYRAAYEALVRHLGTPGSDKYTIRTYATTGKDLKQGVASRLGERSDFAMALASIPLPRFVWVSEIIDRDRRRKKLSRTVRGMMVLDATQLVPLPLDDDLVKVQVKPLFLHLPGAIFVKAAYGLDVSEETPLEDAEWMVASFDAYSTGRWDHARLGADSSFSFMGNAKGAVAPTI